MPFFARMMNNIILVVLKKYSEMKSFITYTFDIYRLQKRI
jgi:hypothetical protein